MPKQTSHTVHELECQRDRLRHQLTQTQDMRQGTLSERFRRCGKPNCHCAQEGARGHGPSFSLTRSIEGKTLTRIIPATQVPLAREQLVEFQKFRELSRQLLEVSEKLCEARLNGDAVASSSSKKKSSKRL